MNYKYDALVAFVLVSFIVAISLVAVIGCKTVYDPATIKAEAEAAILLHPVCK
jgi:hypothetical protein